MLTQGTNSTLPSLLPLRLAHKKISWWLIRVTGNHKYPMWFDISKISQSTINTERSKRNTSSSLRTLTLITTQTICSNFMIEVEFKVRVMPHLRRFF